MTDVDSLVQNRQRLFMERQIMFSLAGELAESMHLGRDAESGFGQDFDSAVSAADWMSASTEEAEAYVHWLGERTRTILRLEPVWDAVTAVADALMEHGTLVHLYNEKRMHSSLGNISPDQFEATTGDEGR
jgi:hypothetical protein